MRSKRWLLPITFILSSCGPHAPLVTDCGINGAQLDCFRGDKISHLTPLQANHYLCLSPTDFLNAKNYILQLERNVANCDQHVLLQPEKTDCAIDGPHEVLFCSLGTNVISLSWAQAQKYLCTSPTDFQLLRNYQTQLLFDLSNCK